MEFMSRNGRNGPASTQTSNESSTSSSSGSSRPSAGKTVGKLGDMRYLMFALLVGSAILIAALSLYVGIKNEPVSVEAAQVDTAKYQAVFLANGQVYFGKIKALTNDVVVIDDIFYIEAQSGTQQNNSNYTLRKLGTSELHSPEDKMIINRAQVTFWENLKDSGKVVTAINEYKKNPDAASQVQGQGNSSNTQPSPTTQNSQNQNKTNNTNTNN